MGTQVKRRDRTGIKIQILTQLCMKGQMAKYSSRIGSICHFVATNPETLEQALSELLQERLIAEIEIKLDNRSIRVLKLTDEGQQLVLSSLPLLSRL